MLDTSNVAQFLDEYIFCGVWDHILNIDLTVLLKKCFTRLNKCQDNNFLLVMLSTTQVLFHVLRRNLIWKINFTKNSSEFWYFIWKLFVAVRLLLLEKLKFPRMKVLTDTKQQNSKKGFQPERRIAIVPIHVLSFLSYCRVWQEWAEPSIGCEKGRILHKSKAQQLL